MKVSRTFARLVVLVILATAGLLVIEAALALGQDEHPDAPKARKWSYAAMGEVPESAREKGNPLGSDPEAVAAGRKLFEQHCAECHGGDAAGAKRGPSLRVTVVQEATPGTLFFILTNGVIRRGMPGWSKLPEPERWQIVSFLHSLRK